MKKIILFVSIFIGALSSLNAQNFNLQDSLKNLEKTKDSRERIIKNINIAFHYAFLKGDSALIFIKEAEKIAKENDIIDLLPLIYVGYTQVEGKVTSNYPMSLYHAFEELKYSLENSKRPKQANENKYARNVELAYYQIAFSYAFLGNTSKALEYLNKIDPKTFIPKQPESFYIEYGWSEISIFGVTAQLYILLNDFENAKIFNARALEINNAAVAKLKWCQPYIVYADILMHDKKYDSAVYYYKWGIELAKKDSYYKDVLEANLGAANAYANLLKIDSAIFHANNVIRLSSDYTFTEGLLKTNLLLYNLYKKQDNRDSSLKYLEAAEVLRDQIFNNAKANDAQNMAINEEVKQRELAEQRTKQQKILIITIIVAILIAFGVYLNVKRLQRERLRKIEEERKNSELEAAKKLQLSMLPKELPKRDDLDIATFIRSSTEVGGDYFDFFPQSNGIVYSVCGDATGHGVSSGMMVSVTKAGLNGIGAVKPNKILQRLNTVVKRIDLGVLRMSLNVVEIEENEVHMSSAAMPPIYYYNAKQNHLEEFLNNGLPLGGLREEHFEIASRKFESGDFIIQLSDGLPEAPNKQGELYDYNRLHDSILQYANLNAKEIVEALVHSVDQWLAGEHNPDDITIVVIKKK